VTLSGVVTFRAKWVWAQSGVGLGTTLTVSWEVYNTENDGLFVPPLFSCTLAIDIIRTDQITRSSRRPCSSELLPSRRS
jgi:hypothetical protein